MKLYAAKTSPFVRKVLVAAHEIGLIDRIEIVEAATGFGNDDRDLAASNPLMKIPTLVMDDGTPLVDSPVICEYLDSLHDGRKLIPPAGPARWKALHLQALGDGVGDANVARRYESVRPEGVRWSGMTELQGTKVRQTLADLDAEAVHFKVEQPLIGEIAIACAIGHVDLRNPEEGWRDYSPNLAKWYEAFSRRPSMLATSPS
jgi:glutathione S-transferase